MRIPGPSTPCLIVAALLASACTSNNPTPPVIAAAGWSWDPAQAGDSPLPVIWWGSATPSPLPVPPGGGCPASGSVQAMFVAEDGTVTLAGISNTCSGSGPATMVPVVWTPGAAAGTFDVAALQLPIWATQGSALVVLRDNGNVLVAGAAGALGAPFPMIWRNGAPLLQMAGTVLPAGYDSGIITSLQTGGKFYIAGGILHRTATGTSPSAFAGVVWVLDTDFSMVAPTLLPLPAEATGASFGPSLSVEILLETVVSASSILSGPGLDKPVVWTDTTPTAVEGLDFGSEPYAVPTGLVLVNSTPYLSGFTREAGTPGRPAPSIWGGTIQEALSTVDPALGLGAGEALAIRNEHAYVAGETYRSGAAPGAPLVSVPAWWDNGARTDLSGLVAPGDGPVLSRPLPAWWRVPGTAMTAPPDWPYTGGFAEIAAGPIPVAAAGSGVARAIGVVPKP